MATKTQKTQTAKNKNLTKGNIYVVATFNNTLITITDDNGNTFCWGSTGKVGFKGSRRSTPYAATTAVDAVVKEAKEMGLKQAKVFIKGPGVGRDAALRVLRSSGIRITQIADVTPIPHNGCRPQKKRKG
ncbi:30S ribosomal protein S11 [Candidatus Beckwithbacteria bacterium]|nr:30S ribosomal protein S11 [Candidatus Beckwithbacteria bacterium]